ncbi:MAG: hypothetical protein WEF86_11505 [Gemmatimonadota bacterium]
MEPNRIHFAYATPLIGGFARRAAVRLARSASQLAPLPVSLAQVHADDSQLASWPRSQPTSVTTNLYRGLKELAPTVLYDFRRRARIDVRADEILLGHPHFPFQAGKSGVVEESVRRGSAEGPVVLLSPLHCDVSVQTWHINADYLRHVGSLLPLSDGLLAVMGRYWWDQWDSSPFHHWKPKMTRLDLAVDSAHFPHLKKEFRAPGQRRYLFIARSDDERKGAALFSRIAQRLGPDKCGWIGAGPDIPHVKRISNVRPLTPAFMRAVAAEYDVFVSTATADPNPTTILEALSWGFPVACTPQSGYYEDDVITSISQDTDAALDVLLSFQRMSDTDLKHRSRLGRCIVESDYTWDRFRQTVTGVIQAL